VTERRCCLVDLADIPPNRRRGGDLRALLTPTTAGATSGFMGLALLGPGERIGEHYHPYSEEFVYIVTGTLEVDLDGRPQPLRPEQGLLIPPHVRHRFRNVGTTEARLVFHLGPLAPRPEQGLLIPPHVRHRFRNVGTTEARLVFHLGPLAPRPELGHVDTEDTTTTPETAADTSPDTAPAPAPAAAASAAVAGEVGP